MRQGHKGRICLAAASAAALLFAGCVKQPSATSLELARNVFAQEGPYALLFAYTTEEQGVEALARETAQIRAELKQAGKKKEISISPPSLESALSVMIWLSLILLATMVGMVVLQAIWSGLAALWSAVRTLIP